MTITQTDADAPSAQGFRTVLRCHWHTDLETGRLVAAWGEELELFPPDAHPA
jgi:hypothetical protein